MHCYPDAGAVRRGFSPVVPYLKDPSFAPEEEVRYTIFTTAYGTPPPCEIQSGAKRYIELTYGGLWSASLTAGPDATGIPPETMEKFRHGKVVREAAPLKYTEVVERPEPLAA